MKTFRGIATVAVLTLGLAPFTPEPHIWKQIKNIWSGRQMQSLDWIDLLIHGVPWIVLFVVFAMEFRGKQTN